MNSRDTRRGSSRRSTSQRRPRQTSSYDEERRRRSRGGAGEVAGGRRLPLVVIVLLAVVAARLVWLQVIDAPRLSARADAMSTTNVAILAKRGTIYDRNGNVLATSVECRTLYCNPRAVGDKNAAAQVLADKLGGQASDYLPTLSQDTTFAYLKRQVDTDVATDVISTLASKDIEGVYTLADVKRVYPYGATAGQVLGFIGTDGHGLSGLELQYDDVLSGTDGEMLVERGRDGSPVAGGASEIHEATDGTDIIVSLDVNVQRVAEEQLAQAMDDTEAKSGNVIVTQPGTGEILAACSWPLFDPTDSSTLTNDALKLMSVSDSYEPGSTFKTLTMAIGYDTGTINKSSTFSVPAQVKVGDDTVTDVDGRDYMMDMTPTEIMRRSSNTGAALVGQAIGADKFAAGIAAFGIGQKTGIDFPGESAGIVPSRDEYTGATTGAAAFGQGIAFPSIQLVRAIGAIANKGTLVTPPFLVQKGSEKADWGQGQQAISSEACESVIGDLREVVLEGTGQEAQVAGYDVVGKTGTGQQALDTGGYLDDSYLSSFIGFANGDDAQVLCYVGLYGTAQHGSAACAPFSAIMSEALTDLSVPTQN